MKWENSFLVFEVSNGPHVIIEKLNAMGEEGWELSSMLNVAGIKIIAFLKRAIHEETEKVDKEAEKISKLWSGE